MLINQDFSFFGIKIKVKFFYIFEYKIFTLDR